MIAAIDAMGDGQPAAENDPFRLDLE
jgi:hypothetical protein